MTTQKPTRAKAAITSRRTQAHESFRSAADCIGTLKAGQSLFAITRGQFSMIDATLACLDQTGPADVSIWTWTIAGYEIECFERLRKDGRIKNGLLIIDYGARGKNADLLRDWQSSFGRESVRTVLNHAKIVTIESANFKLLLRGSMNLNFNPRFEQFDLSEGGPAFDLVKGIERELPVLADDAPGAEVYKASKVSHAFDSQTLELFSGCKTWAK
jgi:hypothetical protein